MTVDAIKTAAQTSMKAAKETGGKVINALGRFFQYLGTTLSGVAKKVAEWAKSAFNSLPKYMQIVKDYANLAWQHVKENKVSVAVGAGIGLVIAGIITGIVKLAHKSENPSCSVSST